MILSKDIVIKDSSIHGRGIFAISDIKSGEVIEEAHHIQMEGSFQTLDSKLKEYVYAWPRLNSVSSSVVFGYASIYNHSVDSNVDWVTDEERNLFVFSTIKDIKAGEELFINYGDSYEKVIKKLT